MVKFSSFFATSEHHIISGIVMARDNVEKYSIGI